MQPLFRHRQLKPFSRLPGFSKSRGHFVPERVSAAALQWARTLLAEEIESELQQVYQNAKDVLGLKHGQVTKLLGQEESVVESPFFRFSIQLRQNRHDPGELVIERGVQLLKEEAELPAHLDSVFPYSPDEAVLALEEASFDEMVVRFEALREEKGGRLKDDETAGSILYEHAAMKILVDFQEGVIVLQPAAVTGCLPLLRLTQDMGFLKGEQ